MPLDLFRQHQKKIFWIVAIVVIPSFVLLWGSNKAWNNSSNDTAAVVVDGATLSYGDIIAFRSRLSYAGLPLGMLTSTIGTNDYILELAYYQAMLNDSQRMGLSVSPIEEAVGRKNPDFQDIDGKFSDEAYKQALRKQNLSPEQYLQGLRERLLINKFMASLDESIVANSDSAYAIWAANGTKSKVEKAFVRKDAFREQALQELESAYDANTEPGDPSSEKRIQEYLNSHSDDPDFRAKSKFSLDFAVISTLPTPEAEAKPINLSEAEINRRFTEGSRGARGKYYNKKLEEVREDIIKEAQNERAKDIAIGVLSRRFDDVYSKLLTQEDSEVFSAKDASSSVSVAALAEAPELKSRRIQIGNTGEAKTLDEIIEVYPWAASPELFDYLKQLDDSSTTASTHEKMIENYSKVFAINKSNSLDNNQQPFTFNNEVFRIRLKEYERGAPLPLRKADGEIDRSLRLVASNKILEEKSWELAKKTAENFAAQMREGNFEGLKIETVDYNNLSSLPQVLSDQALGAVVESKTGDGYDILRLISRSTPSRAEFDALDEITRKQEIEKANTTLRLRSTMQYGMFLPSTRLMWWIENVQNNNRISLKIKIQ